MLDEEMRYFLEYCRIADFSKKSIESLSIRLNEFNEFLNKTTVTSFKDISCQHSRGFVADYKSPSVHIKKACVWRLRQFFHFLKLKGWISENIALDLPYHKIEKTVPKFMTIDEYNRILRYFHENAITLTQTSTNKKSN